MREKKKKKNSRLIERILEIVSREFKPHYLEENPEENGCDYKTPGGRRRPKNDVSIPRTDHSPRPQEAQEYSG
jgi:hypothetical protein